MWAHSQPPTTDEERKANIASRAVAKAEEAAEEAKEKKEEQERQLQVKAEKDANSRLETAVASLIMLSGHSCDHVDSVSKWLTKPGLRSNVMVTNTHTKSKTAVETGLSNTLIVSGSPSRINRKELKCQT